MASPKNVMETDEFVGDERAQEETRLTWEPRFEFPQTSETEEEEHIMTPRTEIAPEEEE